MYKIKNKNILITGGTGQIGSFLSESLVDNGANVTVLGRKISNLKEIKSLVESKKIKFVEYDLINEKNGQVYIEAGADVIMIHSRLKEPNEIFEFCEKYRSFEKNVPLMVVPSSFNSVTEKEWIDVGVNIVCYANHMLRSAYPAMLSVATSILVQKR